MSTILISKIGGFRCHIIDSPSKIDDGLVFKVLETGYVNVSEKRALRNAKAFLKRKRKDFKKHPELYEVKIKRRRKYFQNPLEQQHEIKIKRRRKDGK